MVIIYAHLFEQKKVFTQENSSTPTELIWNTNMAAVLLFSATLKRTDIFETTLLHKSAFRSHTEAKGGWTRSEMHLGRTNQPITSPNLLTAYFT